MSSSAPTEMPAMAPGLVMIIIASVSCVALFLVILMLMLVLYKKDPLCCGYRPSSTQDYVEDPSLYQSRHSLVAIAHHDRASVIQQRTGLPQLPGRFFIVGKPNDYNVDVPPPRLPSYESVRKKDRQRQIHSMIAQRFGLDGCHSEPPPTYEETCWSTEISSVDIPSLNLSSSVPSNNDSLNLRENTRIIHQPPSTPRGPAFSLCPPQNFEIHLLL